MAPRTVYANLQDGLSPLGLWDQSLADMGNLGMIPCTAVGTNAIVLTPIASTFAPTITIPQQLQNFTFVAAATSTGSITIKIGTASALNLYKEDGATQAASGDLVLGVLYGIVFNSALNSSAGGYQITFPITSILNPVISGATISNSTITTSTYNGNTWTAGTGTLTIAAGKTLKVDNSLELAGTDGTVQTFPSTSGTVVTSVTAAGGGLAGTYPNPTVSSVPATAMPALTGDVTTSIGTVATTIAANIVSNAKFRQSAGLSVVGVTGTATANVADITGTANQALVVNSAGTALAFGAVNLASSAAVTGNLPVTNLNSGTSAGSTTFWRGDTTWNTAITSITPGSGLTSTITATAPGSAVTTTGTLSAAQLVNAQSGTSYAILDGDRGKLITATNAGAQAYTIAQAGNASAFQSGWFVDIQNNSTNVAGIITITPTTSQINGASTLKIQPGQFVRVVSDGSNYQVHGIPFGGQIPGTTTNDAANAGNIGEYVQSIVVSGSAISLSDATPVNITSISLTAGDWDVDAYIYYIASGTTSITSVQGFLSLTTGTTDTTPGRFNTNFWAAFVPVANTPDVTCPLIPYRFSFSTTTSVFLVTNQRFTASTLTGYGIIRARRVR